MGTVGISGSARLAVLGALRPVEGSSQDIQGVIGLGGELVGIGVVPGPEVADERLVGRIRLPMNQGLPTTTPSGVGPAISAIFGELKPLPPMIGTVFGMPS